jgi:HlyD family secretion protein
LKFLVIARWPLWVKAGIGFLLLLGCFFYWNSRTVIQSANTTSSKLYQTALIDQGNIAQFVTATGTIRPVAVVIVGAQLSGTVHKIYADYNQSVKKGELLLELDPAIYSAQLRQTRANLLVANAALALAKSNSKRNETLFEKKFISSATFEHDKQEQVSAAAQFELASAQLEKAETDLSNTYIRSPIDGVVLKREVDLGQTVAATFQTPELFQVAQDFNVMQIDTSISEADITAIKESMRATFTVDAFENKIFEGIVKQIRLSPNSQQGSGAVTYNVVINVNNFNLLLLPGMTANVQIVTKLKESVLRIPTNALHFRPSNNDNVNDIEAPKNQAKTDSVQPRDDGSMVHHFSNLQNYRVFRLGADEKLLPIAVKVGVTNRQFSELMGDNLKLGDSVVVQENLDSLSK